MPITQPPKQITVNDIIHSDERVIQLKKIYQEHQNQKNELILNISHVEADIIKTMGAFEFLNDFQETNEAKKELLPTFRVLITKKRQMIDAIKAEDKTMEDTTNDFNKLAQEIVKDLQKQFKGPVSAESCPESAPDDATGCAGCSECQGECKGHNEQSSV